MALYVAVAVILLANSWGAPSAHSNPAKFDLMNPEKNSETWDLNSYGGIYDELNKEDLKNMGILTVKTVTSPSAFIQSSPEDVPKVTKVVRIHQPQLTTPTTPSPLDLLGPGLFGPETDLGMPTCLLCVCLSSSVYCDDSDLVKILPLPKDTTHFYARFNMITEVKAKDFLNLNQLKRIDLTGNQISMLDEDAFRSLPLLQDLFLTDNSIQSLPELPATIRHLDVRNNQLKNTGLHQECFKEMKDLKFLYLSNNRLDYVPVLLPESLRVLHLQSNNIQTLNTDTFCNSHDLSYVRKALEDIRLDGNPIDLNRYAQAYVCLPRLPTGNQQ